MRVLVSALSLVCGGFFFTQCTPDSKGPVHKEFTKADSLTEYYLSLHDSLHQIWNIMIHSDNEKIDAMHGLVHELMVSHPEEIERLKSFEEKIDQLSRIRYTQKSLANVDVIAEYDFATQVVLSELIETVKGTSEFSYNKTLQQLVQTIRETNEEMLFHRHEYDSLIHTYNIFVDANKDNLLQLDETISVEKKPSFRMVSEKTSH
jgi:hypothetical protein